MARPRLAGDVEDSARQVMSIRAQPVEPVVLSALLEVLEGGQVKQHKFKVGQVVALKPTERRQWAECDCGTGRSIFERQQPKITGWPRITDVGRRALKGEA